MGNDLGQRFSSWLVLANQLLLLSNCSEALADFSGKVLGIASCNSIHVMNRGRRKDILLDGIDCPREDQPYGREATQFIFRETFDKKVTIIKTRTNSKGPMWAEVILPDKRNLNHETLKSGYAWWYRKLSKDMSLGDLKTRRD